MGLTIEIYSADPQELVALFAEEWSDAESSAEDKDKLFFEKLETYPVADLSLHLKIPEDMDSLCRVLRKQCPLVPPAFRDLLLEQIWADQPVGISESLTILSDRFAEVLIEFRDEEIEQAALDWAATFPCEEPPHQTLAYQAVLRLREVARDAVARKQSLILHLVG